jgi:hypothetical protein
VAVGTDADLIQAFAEQHVSFAEVPVNPSYVLVKVDGSNSWNDRDLNYWQPCRRMTTSVSLSSAQAIGCMRPYRGRCDSVA